MRRARCGPRKFTATKAIWRWWMGAFSNSLSLVCSRIWRTPATPITATAFLSRIRLRFRGHEFPSLRCRRIARFQTMESIALCKTKSPRKLRQHAHGDGCRKPEDDSDAGDEVQRGPHGCRTPLIGDFVFAGRHFDDCSTGQPPGFVI